MLWNSKLVILDEPTAALGVAQTEQVLKLVRRLADRGLAVILISHNMNDVFEVADNIAVLYLGQMVAQVQATARHPPQVVELITTGRCGGMGIHGRRTAPSDASRQPDHREECRMSAPDDAAACRSAAACRAPRKSGSTTASATTSPRCAVATSVRCRPCSG